MGDLPIFLRVTPGAQGPSDMLASQNDETIKYMYSLFRCTVMVYTGSNSERITLTDYQPD